MTGSANDPRRRQRRNEESRAEDRNRTECVHYKVGEGRFFSVIEHRRDLSEETDPNNERNGEIDSISLHDRNHPSDGQPRYNAERHQRGNRDGRDGEGSEEVAGGVPLETVLKLPRNQPLVVVM